MFSYVVHLFLECEMFQAKVVEKIKRHFVLIFFSKFIPLMRECLKFFTAGQATNDNMTHAHFTLDT
jgi:hypothetical protein